MRILGLDFGSKTVGVAVSDGLLLTAQGVETIERKDENKLRKTCARIEELIAEYEITEIVLGLPKNMNNTEGERVEKTKAFGEMLERRTGLPVHYWDERLTTVAAEQILMESGVRRENRKAVIDKVAAGLILQGYLDCLKTKEDRRRLRTKRVTTKTGNTRQVAGCGLQQTGEYVWKRERSHWSTMTRHWNSMLWRRQN